MYAVVETKNREGESEIFVVLKKWLKNNFVYWPGNQNFTRAVKRKLEMDEDWAFFPCKIIKTDIGKISLFSKFTVQNYNCLLFQMNF